MSEILDNEKKFDFDIGHIIQSPCKTCDRSNQLPNCSENCKMIGKIQAILAGKISCSNEIPEKEPYTVVIG